MVGRALVVVVGTVVVTLGLTALVQAMVKELAEHFDAGKPLSEYPWEMLDENKWLAARHGRNHVRRYRRQGARRGDGGRGAARRPR